MKNKFLKNCLALFVITLVAGISLAFVNEVTKEPIAKAQDKARLEAYEVVYPNAEFKVMDNSDEILKGYHMGQRTDAKLPLLETFVGD